MPSIRAAAASKLRRVPENNSRDNKKRRIGRGTALHFLEYDGLFPAPLVDRVGQDRGHRQRIGYSNLATPFSYRSTILQLTGKESVTFERRATRVVVVVVVLH